MGFSTILIGGGGWWATRELENAMEHPLPVTSPELFDLSAGESVAGIAQALADKGWLEHPLYFRIEAARRGVTSRLQVGTYEIAPGSTLKTLLQKFVKGDVKRYQYTIIEGTTFLQLRTQMANLPGVISTLRKFDDGELMRRIGAGDQRPEGQFFPSTYYYLHRTTDLELLRRAYHEMQHLLGNAWQARQSGLPYRSVCDALIMASIVEKETGRESERPQIAGVFIRRLKQGMKLQTDPTVIYGLGSTFDGNLRKVDLLRDTPFNTYTRLGLPPTPIAMPGARAIHAALNPAQGESLYFVARGDGTHEFSDTLAAHQRAVRKFQLKR